MSMIKSFLISPFCQNLITGVIILDSACLGLLSLNSLRGNKLLESIDEYCLYFFILEMCLKLVILRREFFISRWNIFDLLVVTLSAAPLAGIGNILILRALRLVKLLRVFSTMPQLRFVIAVISKSIPSVLCVGFLLLLVFYVYGVLGTELFASAMPEYFGDLGKSLFTLFQVMTGESWSEAVARPAMKIYPYAWIYFVSFMVIASFIVLNMVIGVIVDSVNEIKSSQNQQ